MHYQGGKTTAAKIQIIHWSEAQSQHSENEVYQVHIYVLRTSTVMVLLTRTVSNQPLRKVNPLVRQDCTIIAHVNAQHFPLLKFKVSMLLIS